MVIWLTPWAFLRGAAANHATMKSQKIDGVAYKVLTWTTPQTSPSGLHYKVVGYVTDQNLVDRVETWVEHPIFGDMHVETSYTDYRDVAGVKVPVHVSEKREGMETFVVRIDEVHTNPIDLPTLVPPVAPTAPPPPLPPAASEKLADGVYRITGGYVSLAVELKDGIVVLEGPQSEARGLAILAEVKRLFPGKKIKYVVNTHPHFDHAGGLAPFAAEGITILEDDNSQYFLQEALSQPRTLLGDALARSKKKPKVEGVIDKMVLGDATRSIELYQVKNLQHSDAMLMAYLPKERILFTADFDIPPPGQPPAPQIATLIENIEQLHLDFDRFVTVHAPNPDRPLTRADLMSLARPARNEGQ
jgi:glyoxylase-like metal-dependent hydrolase (beta-lactamase superfamily II)